MIAFLFFSFGQFFKMFFFVVVGILSDTSDATKTKNYESLQFLSENDGTNDDNEKLKMQEKKWLKLTQIFLRHCCSFEWIIDLNDIASIIFPFNHTENSKRTRRERTRIN